MDIKSSETGKNTLEDLLIAAFSELSEFLSDTPDQLRKFVLLAIEPNQKQQFDRFIYDLETLNENQEYIGNVVDDFKSLHALCGGDKEVVRKLNLDKFYKKYTIDQIIGAVFEYSREFIKSKLENFLNNPQTSPGMTRRSR